MDEQLKDVLQKLKNYQKIGVNFLSTHNGGLQYDEMGLGKTIQTLTSIEMNYQGGINLIICPKFALYVWKAEIKKWFNKESIIYTGTPKQRAQCWEDIIKSNCSYVITNFAQVRELGWLFGYKQKIFKAPKEAEVFRCNELYLHACVIDEAHVSGVFNYKSQFFKTIEQVMKHSQQKYILTGTPVRNGCVDLYGPLHLLDNQKFPNYWSFINKYCVVIDTPFGKQIERNPSNLIIWRNMLKNYMVRRKAKEVLTELPGKRRQKLIVPMSKYQTRVYKELEEEMMTLIPESGEIVITPTVMTNILRQRQVLCSPQLLGSNEVGEGIKAIIEHSHSRLDEGVPVVVFTAFRSLFPILKESFEKEYPGIPIYEIRGGMTADEFGAQWQNFQNGSGKAVMLVVIKSGASFQATRADTAYFIGPEWDASLNMQAEDRLHRIGQERFVNIFYVSYETPVEQRVWELLNEKTEAATFITGSEQEYLRALKNRLNKPK